MKKFLLLFTILLSTFSFSFSQQNDGTKLLDIKRGKFYYNNVRVYKSELPNFVDPVTMGDIKKAYGLRAGGIACITVGSVAAVSGVFIAMFPSNTDNLLSTTTSWFRNGGIGICVMTGGIAVLGGGIAMMIVGTHRLGNVAKTYNLRNGRQISLAPARSGIGMALRF